ncbi:hypothetical protein [Motilimonas pumila]|uniref:Uncharacterized protein n=1 Tax=Motilimonas pumila TaxID=2303987 RepID=A0A418YC50_9GAMM|nr:hypothetical protein [Motilimonas pumila]RJG42091.1 hypothetical protein D1Z90_15005 [Motilimonas pumila]
MPLFRVQVTELTSGKVKTDVRVPLFILSLAGKHTPEPLIRYFLSKSGVSSAESPSFKLVLKTVTQVIVETAKDERLSRYQGVIAEIEDNGERIVLSITDSLLGWPST